MHYLKKKKTCRDDGLPDATGNVGGPGRHANIFARGPPRPGCSSRVANVEGPTNTSHHAKHHHQGANPAASLPTRLVKQLTSWRWQRCPATQTYHKAPAVPKSRLACRSDTLQSVLPDGCCPGNEAQASIIRAERNYESKCWVI